MFSKRGISMVELVVAASMISALALGAMRMLQTQKEQTKKVELSVEMVSLHSRISQTMLDPVACRLTMAQLGPSIMNNASSVLPNGIRDIQNGVNRVIIPIGSEIGNTKIQITSINVVQIGGAWTDKSFNPVEMQVTYLRNSSLFTGATATEASIRKDIHLLVYYDSTVSGGQVTACFSDTATAIEAAKQEYCRMVGGTATVVGGAIQSCSMVTNVPPIPDPTTAASTLFVQNRADAMGTSVATMSEATFVHKAGDDMTGVLDNQVSVTSPNFCIGGNCRTTFATQSCPGANEFATELNRNGTLSCSKATGQCGGNAPFMTGFDPNTANVTCAAAPTKTCALNERVVSMDAAGNVTCEVYQENQIRCADNQSYLHYVNAVATPSCKRINQPALDCGGQFIKQYNMFDAAQNRCGGPPTLNAYLDGLNFGRVWMVRAEGPGEMIDCAAFDRNRVLFGVIRWFTNGSSDPGPRAAEDYIQGACGKYY